MKIPAGVDTGSRVRVAGGGPGGGAATERPRRSLPARDGGPAPRFERKGDDLHVDLPVPVPVAALGGEVSVPTLKGQVSMKIPAETSSGKTFRLRGYGMPHLKGGGAGDEFVKVQIVDAEPGSARERRSCSRS